MISKYNKITIITPSFNQGRFLEETIQSVLNQNYPNLEYIIIDGGSSDNSIEIIKKYENKLTYWVSEKDNGQTNAINKGLRIATGEIINWLNSDDILFPNSLFIINEMFQKNKEVDFIFGDTAQMDENGNIIYIQKAIPFDKNIFLYGRILATQPSVFFRKRVLEQIGVLSEEFDFCMDLDFWGRAIKRKMKFAVCKRVIAGNRFHFQTKTINSQDKLITEHKKIQRNFNVFFSKFSSPYNNFFYEFFRLLYKIKWGMKKMVIRKDFGINRAKKLQRKTKNF